MHFFPSVCFYLIYHQLLTTSSYHQLLLISRITKDNHAMTTIKAQMYEGLCQSGAYWTKKVFVLDKEGWSLLHRPKSEGGKIIIIFLTSAVDDHGTHYCGT